MQISGCIITWSKSPTFPKCSFRFLGVVPSVPITTEIIISRISNSINIISHDRITAAAKILHTDVDKRKKKEEKQVKNNHLDLSVETKTH